MSFTTDSEFPVAVTALARTTDSPNIGGLIFTYTLLVVPLKGSIRPTKRAIFKVVITYIILGVP